VDALDDEGSRVTVKKRGLGRGLDALLGSSSSPSGGSATHPDGTLRTLPVERIVRSRYQPRKDIDQENLQALANSIRTQGIVQPIVVRTAVAGRYEIIAGERRWRAAQLVGLAEIPALIREVPEQSAMAMALVENIQREDLNAIEEAVALKRLIEHFELTHQQAAEAVGRSRAAVSNLLRLLDLDEEIQGLLRENKLEMGHARALLSLPLPLQREASRQVLMHGLSVRETEALVRRLQQEPVDAPVATPVDPNIRVLQSDLSTRLGAKVLVKHTASGRGRLVIHYNSLDELDGILNRVK
jgi:ParB family chromosome partitioning protein